MTTLPQCMRFRAARKERELYPWCSHRRWVFLMPCIKKKKCLILFTMQDDVKDIVESCICKVLQDRLGGWQEGCGSQEVHWRVMRNRGSWRTVLFVNVQKRFALYKLHRPVFCKTQACTLKISAPEGLFYNSGRRIYRTPCFFLSLQSNLVKTFTLTALFSLYWQTDTI